MERRISSYTGCLLGLAAGDGLGHGPERLNGFLNVSGFSQMAAYASNGLLLGLTRGQLSGAMAPPVRYVADALCEWARQQLWRQGNKACWISRSGRMEFRRFSEPELLPGLAAGRTGTMEERISTENSPAALMTAPAAALFYDPGRISRRELQRLGPHPQPDPLRRRHRHRTAEPGGGHQHAAPVWTGVPPDLPGACRPEKGQSPGAQQEHRPGGRAGVPGRQDCRRGSGRCPVSV